LSNFFFVLVVMGLLSFSWWFLDDGLKSATFETPQLIYDLSEPCVPTEPTLLNDNLFPLDKEVLWVSNQHLRFRACQAGVLVFKARGSLFDDYGPYVIVSSGLESLWSGEVREELMSFYLEVPEASWVTIAFTNDAYAPPQDRNVWLSDLSFTPVVE